MKISRKLYGLVVCGGESRRMRADKSSLIYFEKQQRYHLYDMLYSGQNNLCSKAFISCKQIQLKTVSKEYNVLQDLAKFENIGPMAGLLTAFTSYPDHDFLVVGCDYPFVNEQVLKNFLEQIKGDSIAAAFYNEHGKYEPLLAWYSKEAGLILKKQFDTKEHSLQHFLIQNKAEKYIPADDIVMTSVDTPEEFMVAKELLSR
ncbi:molybdenum cofactor guanylyltransferase [Dyadobacter sp. NIV53]|uniref:molybdenum cofactor guanylyltransferase n=1 Tax=Dyadobacter sp. NIV53 TaxID=2861765 RepID=UPI001C87EA20|nr:molybdenum cofactor guanylyltransferase [Dyadobacter sp. NIV53]